MTDEQVALSWLKRISGDTNAAGKHNAVELLRLLARPTLPEEPSPVLLAVMRDALIDGRFSWVNVYDRERYIYAALRAELLKPPPPATKEVDMWHVEYATDAGLPAIHLHTSRDAADLAAEIRSGREYRCVRVTGPHKHVVPA